MVVSNTNSNTDSEAACECNLDRTRDRYDFVTPVGDFVARRAGKNGDRYNTRQLATYVNQCMLRVPLEEADIPSKNDEIENTY